jgi:hypothetical protein
MAGSYAWLWNSAERSDATLSFVVAGMQTCTVATFVMILFLSNQQLRPLQLLWVR